MPTETETMEPTGNKRTKSRRGARNNGSRAQTPATPGTRPTSAAIRQVSAANSTGYEQSGSAAVTQLAGTRYGRSSSPAASSTGRASRNVRSSSLRRALSPGAVHHAWTTSGGPPSRAPSRRSSLFSEDDERTPRAAVHNTETQAWAAFESSIKEIADDTVYFTTKQHNRNFRSSDTFKQVLSDINYVPVVEVQTSHDDDDCSLFSFRPGSAAGDITAADCSVAPSAGAGDNEWIAESHSVIIADPDDLLSLSRAGTALGRKSPGVHFRTNGGDAPSMVGGRLSPAEEEPEAESVPEFGRGRPVVTLLPVADVYSDQKEVRGELYQRYLLRPDTWTSGLMRHLHKTVTRERVPASKMWRTTQIFRPKSAVVNGSRLDNSSARFKRIQSANLPSVNTHEQSRLESRRGSSAKYIR